PRTSLDRFTEGLSMVRHEEMRDLGGERNENGGLDPLLTTDAYLVLPLRHAGQFLGLISLGRKITETRYTAEEMSLLETLANQTSVALKDARLNRLVFDATPDDRFATCFLARVSAAGLDLSFSNAGHNYPILLPARGGSRFLDFGGIPLGIDAEAAYGETSTPLAIGDALILYTD